MMRRLLLSSAAVLLTGCATTPLPGLKPGDVPAAFEQTVNAPPQPGTGEAIELTLQCQVLSRRCLQVNRRLLRDDTDHAPHTPRLLYDIPPHNGSAASRGP